MAGYIVNGIKHYLRERLTFILLFLTFGLYIVHREAEMAQARDMREYLGTAVAGGIIDQSASSITARYAAETAWASERANYAAQRSHVLARKTEHLSLIGFVAALLRGLLYFFWWLPTTLLRLCFAPILWAISCLPVVLRPVALLLVFYYLSRLLIWALDLRNFERQQRIEKYVKGNGGIVGLIAKGLATAIWYAMGWVALPFRIVLWILVVLSETESWAHFKYLCAQGKTDAIERVRGTLLNIQYNQATDQLRFQHQRTSQWLSRNFWRLFFASLVLWLGLQYLSMEAAPKREQPIVFGSLREAAAHFGVDQTPFLPKKEQGSNHLGVPGVVKIAVERPEMLVSWDEVAEERMATYDSIPADVSKRKNSNGVGKVGGTLQGGTETMREGTATELEDLEVKATAMGEGWVGYCQRCRQKHCCEHAE